VASPREEILQALLARLEAINEEGSGYAFEGQLKTVERYVHSVEGTEEETNSFAAPAILIKATAERVQLRSKTPGAVMCALNIAVAFLLKNQAGCADLTAAVDDVKRALFTPPRWHAGWKDELASRPLVEEDGFPTEDGVRFDLEVHYHETF
jgi:hypothetical protein